MQITPISSKINLTYSSLSKQTSLNSQDVFKALTIAVGSDDETITKNQLAELISSQSAKENDVNALLKVFLNFDEIAVDGKLTIDAFANNIEAILSDGKTSELSSKTKIGLNEGLRGILSNSLDTIVNPSQTPVQEVQTVSYEKYLAEVEQCLAQFLQNTNETTSLIEVFA